MKLRFSLRSLVLTMVLLPPFIWLGGPKGFYHHGENYIVNNESGWIAGVYFFRFGIELWGSPNGPTSWQLVRENITTKENPYYSKKIYYQSISYADPQLPVI